MKNIARLLLIVFLVVLLIIVRAYLAPYFYDPLNNYFKNDYLYMEIPKLEFGYYFSNLFMRYAVNTIISLGIIILIF